MRSGTDSCPLSRTVTFVVLAVMLPAAAIHKKRWLQTGILWVGCLLLLIIWFISPPVWDRFFPGRPSPILFQSSGIVGEDIQSTLPTGFGEIETQGRRNMWAVTWNHAKESLLWGHGSGSASAVVNAAYSNLEHPHNDYLRVFHDGGIIGLALFLMAWLHQTWRSFRHWWAAESRSDPSYRRSYSSLILCLALIMLFVTDNAMMYVFIGIPSFLIFSVAETKWQDSVLITRGKDALSETIGKVLSD